MFIRVAIILNDIFSKFYVDKCKIHMLSMYPKTL